MRSIRPTGSPPRAWLSWPFTFLVLLLVILTGAPGGGASSTGSGLHRAPYRGGVSPFGTLYVEGCHGIARNPIRAHFNLSRGFGTFLETTRADSCPGTAGGYTYSAASAGWTILIPIHPPNSSAVSLVTRWNFNVASSLDWVKGRCLPFPQYRAFYNCYLDAQVYIVASAYLYDETSATWFNSNNTWYGWAHTATRTVSCAYHRCFGVNYGPRGPTSRSFGVTWYLNDTITPGDRYALVVVLTGVAWTYQVGSAGYLSGASVSSTLNAGSGGHGVSFRSLQVN